MRCHLLALTRPRPRSIINVIRKWLTQHYYDFTEEPRLFHSMTRFILEKVQVLMGLKWATQLRVIIQEKVGPHTRVEARLDSRSL